MKPAVGAGDGASGPVLAELVPHRPPILAVDRVLAVTDDFAEAEFRVPIAAADADAEGNLWEQTLVEGLAQTASALHATSARRAGRRIARGMLVGIQRFEVRRRARVGETLHYRVELIRELRPLSLVRGIASVGDEVLAQGELKFYVEDEE